jgi:hypothetical protein
MGDDRKPGEGPGPRRPGLILWVWALVFIVFIAMTIYITVAP